MPNQVKVPKDKWDDAIKFLTNGGENHAYALSVAECRWLRTFFRGPFLKGYTTNDAVAVLQKAGWCT